MRRARYGLIALVLAMSTAAFAQEAPSSKKQTKEKSPDFSRDAVLEIFLEDIKPQPASRFDAGFRFDTETTRFRWVPFIAPMFIDFPGGDVTTVAVDPFYLTGTSFPYTSSSYRDRLGEWRMRRMLRKNVEAANRAQNRN